MNQPKVKKNKVVSLGERVVLDQERCILCSRCVRFTSEVSKSHELGIFNRGDRSVIGTFENRPLNNNYSVNTVDICPVGALTSKDFRFKQRVWFLKDFDTICNGCSTGCNVTVSYNQNGVFRVRPRVNKEVNGYWMCDEGRDIYKHTNKEYRLEAVVERNDEIGGKPVKGKPVALALQEISRKIRGKPDSVAVIVTAQYTQEEYEAFFEALMDLGVKNFYYWRNNEETFESFDNLLLRGDKNPNTQGLLKVMEKYGVKGTFADYERGHTKSPFEMTLVAGPENQAVYPDLGKKVDIMKKGGEVAWLTSCKSEKLDLLKWQIPMKSFVEKSGTFINRKSLQQKISGPLSISKEAITLVDLAKAFKENM